MAGAGKGNLHIELIRKPPYVMTLLRQSVPFKMSALGEQLELRTSRPHAPYWSQWQRCKAQQVGRI